MAIRRRESQNGPRFDVEWRLPDRTKRSKTFKSEVRLASSRHPW
jgi:hypothetical protein